MQNTCSHSIGEQRKLGGQTKRVTRRADAKGGEVSSPPNPPQVAGGTSKPPPNAAILVRLTQRSAERMPAGPPSLLFLVGSFRPTARRVRLDKWEKTRRIKAAVPHGRQGTKTLPDKEALGQWCGAAAPPRPAFFSLVCPHPTQTRLQTKRPSVASTKTLLSSLPLPRTPQLLSL